jgi:hypothetical protein
MSPSGTVRHHLRWLLMAAAVIGLFAMHGLSATTASAMSDCGEVPHTHAASAHVMATMADTAAAQAPIAVTSMGLSTLGDASNAGMSCLAILLIGFLAFLVARRTGIWVTPAQAGLQRSDSRSGGRAPPGPEQAELSVWRN